MGEEKLQGSLSSYLKISIILRYHPRSSRNEVSRNEGSRIHQFVYRRR